MNTIAFLSGIAAWFSRQLCKLREARRLRRDLNELAMMTPHELRDIGISHASVAIAARRDSCCA